MMCYLCMTVEDACCSWEHNLKYNGRLCGVRKVVYYCLVYILLLVKVICDKKSIV